MYKYLVRYKLISSKYTSLLKFDFSSKIKSSMSNHIKITKEQGQIPSNKQKAIINTEKQAKRIKNTELKEIERKKEGCSVDSVPQNMYFEYPLHEEFDIFLLRPYYYSYLLAKSNNGRIYLNIDDSSIKSNKEKNEKLKAFLLNLDMLGLEFNMYNPSLSSTSQEENSEKKNKFSIFQSDRIEDYCKYLQFLLDNNLAFLCKCSSFHKCESTCKSEHENGKFQLNFKEDIHFKSELPMNIVKNKHIRINKEKAFTYIKSSMKLYSPINSSGAISNEDFLIPSVNNKEHIFKYNTEITDFPIYKIYSKEFSPTFKSNIDDFLYKITHKIEQLSYSVIKDFILTCLFMFPLKTYTHLPKINIQYWNKTDFPSLSIFSLISERKILPEAILNTCLLMGWSENPIHELKEGMSKKKYVPPFMNLTDAIEKFNTIDIYEINSYFSTDNLFYFNNKYLNYFFFTYPNEIYFSKIKETYKAMKYPVQFKDEFNKTFSRFSQVTQTWSDATWRKVIRIVIPKIKSYEYLYLFSFLLEAPLYNNDYLARHIKLIRSYFTNDKKALLFMYELISTIQSVESENFKSHYIDKRLSEMIYSMYQLDSHNEGSNRLVYSILKICIADNLEILHISEVIQVIGKEESLSRLHSFNSFLGKIEYSLV